MKIKHVILRQVGPPKTATPGGVRRGPGGVTAKPQGFETVKIEYEEITVSKP